MKPTRKRLQQPFDGMPNREIDDPFLRALANAPEDDEPLTSEEEAAIAEAYAEIAASETIPDEELWRRLNDEVAL